MGGRRGTTLAMSEEEAFQMGRAADGGPSREAGMGAGVPNGASREGGEVSHSTGEREPGDGRRSSTPGVLAEPVAGRGAGRRGRDNRRR